MTLSIILVDTVLSPFIVPLSLSVLAGANVQMDVWGMMKGLAEMVVIPSIAGMMVNQFSPPVRTQAISRSLSPFQKSV